MIRDAAMQWARAIRDWRKEAQEADLTTRYELLVDVDRTETYVLRRLWESLD